MLCDSEFEGRIAILNDSQRLPYEKVSRALYEFRMRTRESMPSPFRMFISGGTGSHVISVIKDHFILVLEMLAFSWHQLVLQPLILVD